MHYPKLFCLFSLTGRLLLMTAATAQVVEILGKLSNFSGSGRDGRQSNNWRKFRAAPYNPSPRRIWRDSGHFKQGSPGQLAIDFLCSAHAGDDNLYKSDGDRHHPGQTYVLLSHNRSVRRIYTMAAVGRGAAHITDYAGIRWQVG